jgi:hypothetical protein
MYVRYDDRYQYSALAAPTPHCFPTWPAAAAVSHLTRLACPLLADPRHLMPGGEHWMPLGAVLDSLRLGLADGLIPPPERCCSQALMVRVILAQIPLLTATAEKRRQFLSHSLKQKTRKCMPKIMSYYTFT